MLDSLTSDDLYALILMLRTVEQRVVLVVEGESDYLALQEHINEQIVNMIPGNGKAVNEPAMEMIAKDGIDDVIALLDRDFRDYLQDTSADRDNVFYTDYYDLDATIFFCDSVCRRVAFNFGRRVNLEAFLAQRGGVEVQQVAQDLALPLGMLRFISVRDGLNLSLQRFPLGEAVKPDCSSVDTQRLAQIAISKSPSPVNASPSELSTSIMQMVANAAEKKPFCSGHDLVKALSVILRVGGGYAVSWDSLERAFRAAFACEDLRKTNFYLEIRA